MGGIGSFSNKNIFKVNERLYVSEAAGLQDFFGDLELIVPSPLDFWLQKALLKMRITLKLPMHILMKN